MSVFMGSVQLQPPFLYCNVKLPFMGEDMAMGEDAKL